MAKPHIKRQGHCWLCRTPGFTGLGHTAREAYALWLWGSSTIARDIAKELQQ